VLPDISSLDFSHLTIAGGWFAIGSQHWTVKQAAHQEFLVYDLYRAADHIGQAKCQPSSLIRANLSGSASAQLSVDPIVVQLYGGQCHWIETLQILPAFRGQGYGSLWLEALCALLDSEQQLPIALYADEWWDQTSPLQGQALADWYDRHGFLSCPVNGLLTLRVRQ
jgi:GNAT superfamily N-acetyltransferase